MPTSQADPDGPTDTLTATAKELADDHCFCCGLAFQDGDSFVQREFRIRDTDFGLKSCWFGFHADDCADEDADLINPLWSAVRLCDALQLEGQQRADLIAAMQEATPAS